MAQTPRGNFSGRLRQQPPEPGEGRRAAGYASTPSPPLRGPPRRAHPHARPLPHAHPRPRSGQPLPLPGHSTRVPARPGVGGALVPMATPVARRGGHRWPAPLLPLRRGCPLPGHPGPASSPPPAALRPTARPSPRDRTGREPPRQRGADFLRCCSVLTAAARGEDPPGERYEGGGGG